MRHRIGVLGCCDADIEILAPGSSDVRIIEKLRIRWWQPQIEPDGVLRYVIVPSRSWPPMKLRSLPAAAGSSTEEDITQ